MTADEIRRILHFLRQHYDYIVVDTSKSFSPATLAAFEQADLVFLVTNVDLPSLRNIQRGLPLLKRVLARGEEQIRLVVNRYHPDDEISLKDVERTLGLKVYWTLSNDYEAVMRLDQHRQAHRAERQLASTPGTSRRCGAQVTGVREDAAPRSRLAQALAAPFRGCGRIAKRREGGK